jgi:hypothetical protein
MRAKSAWDSVAQYTFAPQAAETAEGKGGDTGEGKTRTKINPVVRIA